MRKLHDTSDGSDQGQDEQRVPFLDIDFGSGSDPDDETYSLPCTPDRLSTSHHWDPDESECEYEEPDDTPPAQMELPIPHLAASEAQWSPDLWCERVELLYSGTTRGCEPGMLRVWIHSLMPKKDWASEDRYSDA
ncbi:hypothetical protein BJX76DRAFT_363065 [Aspergillus varians]